MLTNLGKNLIRDWMGSVFPNPPSYMALGSVSTAATVDDTALGSEIPETKLGFDSISKSDRMVEFEMILPSTAPSSQPINIREVGLFDGSPIGSLYTHNTFTAVEKTEDVELQSIIGVRVE